MLRSQCRVQLVARIKGVNKIIFFEKCGGFNGYFYTFNEFGELYFVHQDARYDLNVACSLLHE